MKKAHRIAFLVNNEKYVEAYNMAKQEFSINPSDRLDILNTLGLAVNALQKECNDLQAMRATENGPEFTQKQNLLEEIQAFVQASYEKMIEP